MNSTKESALVFSITFDQCFLPYYLGNNRFTFLLEHLNHFSSLYKHTELHNNSPVGVLMWGVLKTCVNFLRKGLLCSLCLKLSFPMLHKPWWCLHSCVDIKSRVRQHSLLSQKEDNWIQNLEIIQWHLVVMMLCLDERCWTSAKLYFATSLSPW